MSIRKHYRAPDLTENNSHCLPMGTIPFCLTINHTEMSRSQAWGGLQSTFPCWWHAGAGNNTWVFGCKNPSASKSWSIPPPTAELQTDAHTHASVLSSFRPCHGTKFGSHQNHQVNTHTSNAAQTQPTAEPGSHWDPGDKSGGLCSIGSHQHGRLSG